MLSLAIPQLKGGLVLFLLMFWIGVCQLIIGYVAASTGQKAKAAFWLTIAPLWLFFVFTAF